jgi:hypothetical protein
MASNIAIQNDDEFGRLLRGLAQDVIDAHIHWGQYLALHAQMERSPQVTAEAYTFWHYTLVAHQRTSLMSLARAYENDQRGLHLRSWLIAIREHLHLFSKDQVTRGRPDDPFTKWISEEAAKPSSEQLEQDIKDCSIYDNADVKALHVYRGNLLAHRNAELMKQGDPSKLPPLSIEQVEALLARSVNVLNRYAYMFETTIYGTQPVGHDSIERIFESIQRDLDQRDRLIQQQVVALSKQAQTDSDPTT